MAGAAVLLAGWVLGSVPLLLAGLGLLGAALAALGLTRVALGRVRIDRVVASPVLVEGDDLTVQVQATGAQALPGGVRLRDELGGRPGEEITLARRGPSSVVFRGVPRGLHRLGPGTILVEDPLGLVTATRPGTTGGTIRVRPRVVPLPLPFTSRVGRVAGGHRRGRLVRPEGTEPQGVREHRDGESLRSVHWPTSARTGRLMVRETDDPGRDDLVVVLDLEAAGVVGEVGRSSLDDAVRAAAALVHAEARAGRSVSLVIAGTDAARLGVRGGVGWEEALDALAAAAPVSGASTEAVLAGADRLGGEAMLVLVTTCSPARHADVLLRRRRAAVVLVDAPTYAGAPRSAAEPTLLRLAAHGVAVVVVRAGDDLATVLARPAEAARA